jgi:hypothetical protein
LGRLVWGKGIKLSEFGVRNGVFGDKFDGLKDFGDRFDSLENFLWECVE